MEEFTLIMIVMNVAVFLWVLANRKKGDLAPKVTMSLMLSLLSMAACVLDDSLITKEQLVIPLIMGFATFLFSINMMLGGGKN